MRNMQREKAQADVIKSANASHPDYPRYASFGADYVFAVPKSFAVDELSAPGVQLLMPGGNIKANKLEDLYGSGVAAVQPIAAAQANMGYLQKARIQYLINNPDSNLKKQANPAQLADAVKDVDPYVHGSIVVPGRSIQKDQFVGQLSFSSINKSVQQGLGFINLQKEGGAWKLAGLRLPSAKAGQ